MITPGNVNHPIRNPGIYRIIIFVVNPLSDKIIVVSGWVQRDVCRHLII
jgi:hypothetical protein